jgi:hypothetical protein
MAATLMPADHLKHIVEPSIQVDGLLALIAAAQALEQLAQQSPRPSEREHRKMQAYVRRFEEMEKEQPQPQKQKRTKTEERVPGLVGRTLRKKFKDGRGRPKMYLGQVMSVSCATKDCPFDFGAGVTATVKYSVHYEDGDAEDMTHAEVLRHLVD